jgi:hypothetical protein
MVKKYSTGSNLPFAETSGISGKSNLLNGTEWLELSSEILLGDIKQQVTNVATIGRLNLRTGEIITTIV